MTKRAKNKLQSKMRRTWKKAVQARRKHERMLKSYKRMQRQYRAA
ncbi:MAG TPA: hypothetical protein VFC25_07655 [Verrucomicrobiae bacterium]|jgi:hypothetical protein|nr:hypothetical protein [Candidatus Polarisedimenticolia bacterium]HYV18889.1 hypothetical protein [Verrucomicrobiae bacterium]